MAITPNTIVRNPLLLALLTALAIPAAAFFMCGERSNTCRSARTVSQVQVANQTAVAVKHAKPVVQRAQPVIRQAQRGWLGVKIQTLNPRRAEASGLKVDRGVLVMGLLDAMPAQTAGFQPNDVITHFAGQALTASCQLVERVQATAPGTRVPVLVNRNGVELTLYPTLTRSNLPASSCRSRRCNSGK